MFCNNIEVTVLIMILWWTVTQPNFVAKWLLLSEVYPTLGNTIWCAAADTFWVSDSPRFLLFMAVIFWLLHNFQSWGIVVHVSGWIQCSKNVIIFFVVDLALSEWWGYRQRFGDSPRPVVGIMLFLHWLASILWDVRLRRVFQRGQAWVGNQGTLLRVRKPRISG